MHRRQVLTGVLAALAGCALQSGATPVASRRRAFDAQQLARLEPALDQLVQRGQLPCAALIVARDGVVAQRLQLGWQDVESRRPLAADTVYRIFSMTKPVTAAAVMLLHDEGRLRLDQPVARYVPEFAQLRVQPGGEPARPMRVAQLLTHTSGLGNSFNPGSAVAPLYAAAGLGAGLGAGSWFRDPRIGGLGGFATRLAGIPLEFQPGERWLYSVGPDIAGLVVERVAGMPFETFLAQRLFEPLGMRDTGFALAPSQAARMASLYGPAPGGGLRPLEAGGSSAYLQAPAAASGSGGLVSTLDDYFRFAQMLCNGGTLEGRRVLSAAAVDLITANHLQPSQATGLEQAVRFGLGGSGKGLGFGLGGAVVIDPTQGRGPGSVGEYAWGGAASTTFWIDRRERVTVVFMTQLLPSGTLPLRDLLQTQVYQALA